MDELLLERERLDQTIKDSFSKEVTILFSDICGYTQYTDKKGDLQSRAMLLRHNQIVFPAIEASHGKVIEVIGDGVMAAFFSPIHAVQAAVEVQRRLRAANKDVPADGEIHVKIGINMGTALLDENAEFQSLTGNVANVAARLQSHADKDEILMSKALYDQIKDNTDWICRFHGNVTFKGKSESTLIYRLIWKGTEPRWDVPQSVALSEGEAPATESDARTRSPVVTLELNRDGRNLNISIHEKQQGAESTLRHYDTIPFESAIIEDRCRMMVEAFNKANRRGQASGKVLDQLREIGQVLYDELLSLNVKERLYQTKATTLILSLDDRLVHIPWELLYDGKQFFCMRFSMGRVVKTRQAPSTVAGRSLSAPLDMLVLADPTGDLKNAYTEGTQIRDFLDQNPDLIHASLRTDYMTAETLKAKLRNFDLIHFAGHAEYNPGNPETGGWRLRDSSLTTDDIVRMAGSTRMPTMVFANACQSARTEQWLLNDAFEHQIFGLANAFLLSGVKHYIGTFWEILDEQGSHFAIEFYKHLFSGGSIGQAVLNARHALVDLYGEETIIWASYVFYGDPTFNYMAQIKAEPAEEKQKTDAIPKPAAKDRTREEVVDFQNSHKKRSLARWWSAAAIFLLLAAIGLWGLPWYRTRGVAELEHKAFAYYLSGEYEKSNQLCRVLQRDAPQRPMSAVILGNISLSRGKLEDARRFFNLAIETSKDSERTKSEALMGLGRLASIGSRTEAALDYYHQAAGIDPGNARAASSQAVLLERQGNYKDALRLYSLASSLAPEDISLKVAVSQMRERLALQEDDARQARIDRLIEDILAASRASDPGASAQEWSSKPLTVWLLDFETSGFDTQEGSERLIHGLVSKSIVENARVQLVERAVWEQLLSELKIGTSPLVNRDTALAVGRLAAARILLSGRLLFLQGQLRATVRIIECETGLVLASIVEEFNQTAPPRVVAEILSSRILDEVERNYPLRARIAAILNSAAVIDIGKKVGARPGMLFKGQEGNITIRVRSVGSLESDAEIIAGMPDIHPGLKLEEQFVADN